MEAPPKPPRRGNNLGPRATKLAAVFYGLMVVAAALWNGLRGRGLPLLGDSLLAGAALGLAAAGITFFIGVLVYRLSPTMRRLADELAPTVVDGASLRDLMLVSLFSGIGEEALFRGAVQPEFGLFVAAIAFGVLHVGPDRRYLIWTVWALLAGLLFGWLFLLTGGLLAPVLAHVVHNAATFTLWKRSRPPKDLETAGETP